MRHRLSGLLLAVAISCHATDLRAETVVLRSGKQVEIIDGALTAKGAEEVLREASDWLKRGRVDYAREYWRLLSDKAQGLPAKRAKAAQEKLTGIEYRSFIMLINGKLLTGNVKAELRTDLLGLEGKQEIPVWEIEEIIAEYHSGYSRITRTFYPLTILEIKLRGRTLQTARMMQEVEFVVEDEKGSITRAILGKEYEILRPENLREQIDALTENRVLKVVIYPNVARQDW